jgi:outer membrane protein OmpA-like peptidoglycan-associated protein
MAATELEFLGEREDEFEEEAMELEPLFSQWGASAQRFGYREFGYTPWRDRTDLRPKPQYIKFLNLDQFIWNKASLTPRLRQMAEYLAKHVKLSWQTMQPIAYIRLIGHTDNTGPEKYNLDLGNWRAQTVKKTLEELLKEDILKRRVAIIVENSPGSSVRVADNRTALGRALNRRVEVFVAPPEPPPEPKKPFDPTPPDPGPGRPRRDPWGPISPVPPGRSFKDWLNEEMEKLGVPKVLRTRIWDAVFDKNWGLLSNLLEAAGFSGGMKDAIIEAARALGEGRAP